VSGRWSFASGIVHADWLVGAFRAETDGEPPAGFRQQESMVVFAVTSASVFAVETCAEVVAHLFRYGGGRVLSLSHPMQRHPRNALAARQHVAVSEEHYEAAGRERIQSAKSRRE
jgi:Acyl-CoA dehydrogenase, C-terminal domain